MTPAPEVASTFDPAATTPDSPVPPPAGATVQAVPFHRAAYEPVHTCPSPRENSRIPTAHSPAAVLARPVMTTEVCAVTGGAGQVAPGHPLDCFTWAPPAIHTRPRGAGTASREP